MSVGVKEPRLPNGRERKGSEGWGGRVTFVVCREIDVVEDFGIRLDRVASTRVSTSVTLSRDGPREVTERVGVGEVVKFRSTNSP